nr:MAG TPA: hypothetical protein [Caudoviricetes sp.]
MFVTGVARNIPRILVEIQSLCITNLVMKARYGMVRSYSSLCARSAPISLQEYSERCLHTIPLKILSVNDPKGC